MRFRLDTSVMKRLLRHLESLSSEQRRKDMTNEEQHLIVETLGEMRELKGEMREFRLHVIGRVEKLEKKEVERSKERISVISILISAAALAVAIIANFFRHRG